jgi:hypothetical protein
MQHPFDGILGKTARPATAQEQPTGPRLTRRSLLGKLFAAALGGAGAASVARASVPPGGATTFALGEEGGVRVPPPPRLPGVTTFALGEEGGPRPPRFPRPPRRVTTLALGEEGGVVPPPPPPPPPPPWWYTTYAVGEEGGYYY